MNYWLTVNRKCYLHLITCPAATNVYLLIYLKTCPQSRRLQTNKLWTNNSDYFKITSASLCLPSIYSPNLVSTLIIPSCFSDCWPFQLEFLTANLRPINSYTAFESNLKLTYSLVHEFLGILAPDNSIHAFLIWHNLWWFCVKIILHYST